MWTEYTEGSTREGRLVKALDRLEMLLQALVYERAGSRAMAEFWSDIDDNWSEEFPAIRVLVQHLIVKRHNLNGVTRH